MNVFDWPAVIRPNAMLVRVAPTLREGEISRGGFENSIALPGGRVMLEMKFGRQSANPEVRRWYSWLVSRLPGSMFRVRLDCCGQLARTPEMTAIAKANSNGIPFDRGGVEKPFSTGSGFRFHPTGDVTTGALEGETTISVDFSRWPSAVQVGHVIGFGEGTYEVMDIRYEGTIADVTVTPPFRRDIDVGEWCFLRPSLICKAVNGQSFAGALHLNRFVDPGELTMREVVDERFL